MPPTSSLYY